MSNDCKIVLKGLDNVIVNLNNVTDKFKKALYLDSNNISKNMESWAKSNANWTDRTGHARQFLRATVTWESSDKLLIALSHHVEYGMWLELCREGRYAILEKTITEYAPQFAKSWKAIAEGAGVI